MPRRLYRLLAALFCGLIAGMIVLAGDGWLPVDGVVYDMAVRLHAGLSPRVDAAPDTSVAVVVLDDRSLSAPELSALPRAFLGPQWGKMLDALFAAGAEAVGFDFIFQYSANQFIDGFDAPFFTALETHRDRTVLGRSIQTSVGLPYHYAVGADEDEHALGLLEIVPDNDGVFRRVTSALYDVDGEPHPTLSAAVLRRAGRVGMPAEGLAAPDGPLELVVPGYSLIDVLRCADADGGPEVLKAAFAGRMVLVGSVLPEEDRKPAADRFFPIPWDKVARRRAAADGTGCDLLTQGVSGAGSGTIPGVFVHAAVIDATARGHSIRLAAPWQTALATVLVLFASTLLAFRLRAGQAALVGFAVAGSCFVADVALMHLLRWVPPGGVLMTLPAAIGLAFLLRYVAEERRSRRVQTIFSQYLSPAMIERILEEEEEDEAIKTGGEERDVTVMFLQLTGLTAAVGHHPPRTVVEATNTYLSVVVEAIEAHGGYVDKFIGAGVMALWGAPAADESRTANALLAATEAVWRTRVLARRAADLGEPVLVTHIGINSGPTVVANLGTSNRFNYTAIGPVVSLAAHLENLSGRYRCPILVGPETAERLAPDTLLRRVDVVRPGGQGEAVPVFEPIAPLATATAAQRSHVAVYEMALDAWLAGNTATAVEAWRRLLPPAGTGADGGMGTAAESEAGGGPAAVMLERLTGARAPAPGRTAAPLAPGPRS